VSILFSETLWSIFIHLAIVAFQNRELREITRNSDKI